MIRLSGIPTDVVKIGNFMTGLEMIIVSKEGKVINDAMESIDVFLKFDYLSIVCLLFVILMVLVVGIVSSWIVSSLSSTMTKTLIKTWRHLFEMYGVTVRQENHKSSSIGGNLTWTLWCVMCLIVIYGFLCNEISVNMVVEDL